MNEQLIEKIKACTTLPSMPAVAMEVLDLVQQPEVDLTQIANLIQRDPALTGKILRTVNSSFYARSSNVGSINQALVILGLQSVKTLVLGFSLVTGLSGKKEGFDHNRYWKRSLYAATAARCLCDKLKIVQHEEAFLATLLADIGMMVLNEVVGEAYGAICALPTHEDQTIRERAELGLTHADAGGILVAQWKLPPLLAVPIAKHHTASEVEDPAMKLMCEVVLLAGLCGDLFCTVDPAPVLTAIRNGFQAQGISGTETDELLKDISTKAQETAKLFEMKIGAKADYEAILKRANNALVEITLQSQQHATQLQQQNQVLQEKATTDGLTGLANRATFDTFIEEALSAAVQSGTCCALLMMDIDKFKSINDTHGHPTGDAVLRGVARFMKNAGRPGDLVARFGGEEMVIVLPGMNRTGAAVLAEGVRATLEATPIVTDEGAISVTASFGIAAYEPGSPLSKPGVLLKAADMAVYQAKHAGRNNVKVFALKAAA